VGGSGVVEPADPGDGANSPAAPDHWPLIRRWTAVAYFVGIALIIVLVGLPTDRGSLAAAILVGLAIPCLGRGWRAYLQVLIDWLPFTAVLYAYDYSRGLAHWIGLPLHISDVASVDRTVFGGTVPSVWLQQHFLIPGRPQWYDAAATLIYTTHFLATPIVAAVLWVRSRALWLAFITRVIVLSVAGLLTYLFFPAAPPWYAAREGVIGPVLRTSARGYLWLHLNHAGNLLTAGQGSANDVAAMPSLHTAFATLIALFIGTRLRTRWRYLLVLYPIAMGISLVYLGEHYVVDVVAGVVYALAIHALVRWWERRRVRS
jgi:membrane-associated phospholipid phosphatase